MNIAIHGELSEHRGHGTEDIKELAGGLSLIQMCTPPKEKEHIHTKFIIESGSFFNRIVRISDKQSVSLNSMSACKNATILVKIQK